MKLQPRVLFGVILIAGVSILEYFPSLHGGFIFDDDIHLTNAPHIQSPDGLYRIWCTTAAADNYLVANTTLWLEWRLWEMNPTGYHVTNLLLHIGGCLLIWRLFLKLSIPGAYLAALLFAVHPVNVESVAWISQRKELLAAIFFMLSILWYLDADNHQRANRASKMGWKATFCAGPWYWLSLLAFVLAMLSKGTVAVLPLILLLIAWWRRGRIDRSDLLASAPFFFIAIVITPVTIWSVTQGSWEIRNATLFQRLLGAGSVVWFYLSKALLPVDLAFVYPQWQIQTSNILWWLPLLAVGITTALLGRRWPQSNWARHLFFAWTFFCVALVPVMGFADTGYMRFSLVADHYQHIALIGVTGLTAAGWAEWKNRSQGLMRGVAFATAAAVVTIFTLTTWQQNLLYADAITLYQATLMANPNSRMLQNNLASACVDADRLPEGIAQCQQAIKRWHDNPEAYLIWGNAMLKLDRPQEAIEHYRQALRIRPEYAEAHYNLGHVFVQINQPQEAIEHFREALRLKPDNAAAHYDLGNAFVQSNQLPDAIEQYRQALQLRPNHVWTHNNLGNALAETGQVQEAIEQFQQAVQIQADFVDAWRNLAEAYAQTSRTAEAVDAAQKAISIARSQNQAALAEQIQSWLSAYQSQLVR